MIKDCFKNADSEKKFVPDYMFLIIASPNSEHFTSFAPSISRAKSYETVFAWMLLIGIVVFGLVAFMRLGVSQLPDVDFPVLTVTTTWQNAAPEVMETVVTDAIEDSIMGVEGIQEVTSTGKINYVGQGQ